MLTTSKPSEPKIKTPERNVKIKSDTVFCAVYDPIRAIARVNKDIQTGKNNIHASKTRKFCFIESGCSPE
jgi:hypothetical protein